MPSFYEMLEGAKPHLFDKFNGRLNQENKDKVLTLFVFIQADISFSLQELIELHDFWRESFGKHDFIGMESYDLVVRGTLGKVTFTSNWESQDNKSPS